MFCALSGATLLAVIDYLPMPAVSAISKIELSGGNLIVTFAAAVNVNNYFFMLSLTSPRRPSIFFSPRGLRVMPVQFSTAVTFNLSASYAAAFGALPAVGAVIHASIRYFAIHSPVYLSPITSIITVQ